jgi:hypothetical protein
MRRRGLITIVSVGLLGLMALDGRAGATTQRDHAAIRAARTICGDRAVHDAAPGSGWGGVALTLAPGPPTAASVYWSSGSPIPYAQYVTAEVGDALPLQGKIYLVKKIVPDTRPREINGLVITQSSHDCAVLQSKYSYGRTNIILTPSNYGFLFFPKPDGGGTVAYLREIQTDKSGKVKSATIAYQVLSSDQRNHRGVQIADNLPIGTVDISQSGTFVLPTVGCFLVRGTMLESRRHMRWMILAHASS